jgi:hypothetical protein
VYGIGHALAANGPNGEIDVFQSEAMSGQQLKGKFSRCNPPQR